MTLDSLSKEKFHGSPNLFDFMSCVEQKITWQNVQAAVFYMKMDGDKGLWIVIDNRIYNFIA